MIDNIVERVARAIYISEFDGRQMPAEGSTEQALQIQKARAAIEAMREPTADMVKMGGYNLEGCLGEDCNETPLHTYHTMIDAALEEK